MHRLIAVVALIGVITVPLGAQGRGRGRGANGVPPGQMPPAGLCRVWYDGRPPGQQPRPMNCDDAERIASRERNARVIYGSDVRYGGRYEDRRDRRDERRAERRDRNQDRRGGYGQGSVAFDNGSRDGYTKGQEDVRRNRSFDPVRHDWYQDANRGYNSRYGTREDYRDAYRAGFRTGYEDGYRDYRDGRDRDQGGGVRFPWPF
jgi:hypothetical protein